MLLQYSYKQATIITTNSLCSVSVPGTTPSYHHRPMPGLLSRSGVSQFRQSGGGSGSSNLFPGGALGQTTAPHGPRIPKAVASLGILPTSEEYEDFVSNPSSPPPMANLDLPPLYSSFMMFDHLHGSHHHHHEKEHHKGKGKGKRRKGRGGGAGSSALSLSNPNKKRQPRRSVSNRELANLGWTIKDKDAPVPPPGISLTAPAAAAIAQAVAASNEQLETRSDPPPPPPPPVEAKKEDKVVRTRGAKGTKTPNMNPVVVLDKKADAAAAEEALAQAKAPPKIRINLTKLGSFQLAETTKVEEKTEPVVAPPPAPPPKPFVGAAVAETEPSNKDVSPLRRVRHGKPLKKRIAAPGAAVEPRNGLTAAPAPEPAPKVNGTASEQPGKRGRKQKQGPQQVVSAFSSGIKLKIKFGGGPAPDPAPADPGVPKLKLKLSKGPSGGYTMSGRDKEDMVAKDDSSSCEVR